MPASLSPGSSLKRHGLLLGLVALLGIIVVPATAGPLLAGQRLLGTFAFAIIVRMTEPLSYAASAAAKASLEAHGAPIVGTSDHRVSQSLYLTDPDGNEIELYVDADPRIWKDDPSAVATVEPLDL